MQTSSEESLKGRVLSAQYPLEPIPPVPPLLRSLFPVTSQRRMTCLAWRWPFQLPAMALSHGPTPFAHGVLRNHLWLLPCGYHRFHSVLESLPCMQHRNCSSVFKNIKQNLTYM